MYHTLKLVHFMGNNTTIEIMFFLDDEAIRYLTVTGLYEWSKTVDQKTFSTIEKANLKLIKPLRGGRTGAVALCENQTGNKVVVKTSHPVRGKLQVAALKALSQPTLISEHPEYDSYIISFVDGITINKEEKVDPIMLAEAIKKYSVISPPAEFIDDLQASKLWDNEIEDVGGHAQEILEWASYMRRWMSSGDFFLHGDITKSNLMVSNNKIIPVDYAGVKGSLEYEIGFAAVYCSDNDHNFIFELSKLLEANVHKALLWASIKSVYASISFTNRGIHDKAEDKLAFAQKLRKMI